jgi:hypothetical protein
LPKEKNKQFLLISSKIQHNLVKVYANGFAKKFDITAKINIVGLKDREDIFSRFSGNRHSCFFKEIAFNRDVLRFLLPYFKFQRSSNRRAL